MSHQNKSRFSFGVYTAVLLLCVIAAGIGYTRMRSDEPAPADTPVLATEDMPVSIRQRKPVQPTEAPRPAETEPAGPRRLETCAPVSGEVLSPYAAECLSYNETTRDWRTHSGMDIGAAAGTAVVAAADGEVYTVYEDEQMGTTVVIRHAGGYTTKYQSLAAQTAVAPGDAVRMGQTIGSVGSTALMESALGDHVHFSVTKDDEPMDPELFLAG